MKKLYLLFLLFVLSGCSSKPLGVGVLTAKESQLLSSITTTENNYTSPRPTFKQYKTIPETYNSASGVTYKVEDYVVWDGNEIPKETGYMVYIKRADGSIMATGTGSLAKSLSYNWYIPVIATETSSTTP